MIRTILAILAVSSIIFRAETQVSLNVDLQSNWDDGTLPNNGGQVYNDIWGYAALNGTEVAILGSLEQVHFIDVTNPSSPTVIDEFLTYSVSNPTDVVSSIWRDFKTYDHYVYAVADQGDLGLMIFDVSNVPNSVALVYQDNQFFNHAHNVWIDEQHGRLYAIGTHFSSPDVVVLDIATDPENPLMLASVDVTGSYIHDIHVVDHIAYASSGNDGLIIFDFETPASPVWLATVDGYPEEGYNHSSWLGDDGATLVFCDETHGKSVKLVDVTDPLDLGPTDFKLFKSQLIPNNTNSIAHNPFILGDLAIIAYYHDGVQIFDISDPENIVNAGYYDTYPNNTGYSGYDGCWGVYPYLPSGNILASDTENGLFVLDYNPVPLPLGFLSFQAEVTESGQVRLRWTVEQPRDGDQYRIESGHAPESLQKIGTVSGDQSKREYEFMYEPASFGTQYYRIRAIEQDGSEVISPIRALNIKGFEDFRIFPTHTRGMVFIDGLSNIETVRIFNLDGKLLQSREVEQASARYSVDLSSVSKGMYILEFVTPTKRITEQIVRY
jgi:choice-of-anchor B domain-containing protein